MCAHNLTKTKQPQGFSKELDKGTHKGPPTSTLSRSVIVRHIVLRMAPIRNPERIALPSRRTLEAEGEGGKGREDY